MTVAPEVPVLGDSDQGRAWTHAALQGLWVVGQILAARRAELERLAWGTKKEAEKAALLHKRRERAANPPVRMMTDEERGQFDDAVQRGLGQVRGAVGTHGSVVVTAAPLQQAGTWGLGVVGTAGDGAVTQTHVRCLDHAAAENLTSELLKGTPATVGRLSLFAEQATRRAQQVADEVAADIAEPEPQRLARTAATVRQVWPPELAEQVIGPTAAGRGQGEGVNPAFGAFAWRLHELEQYGFQMRDVLVHLDVVKLREHWVRNPAALAESWLEEKLESLDAEAGRAFTADGSDLNAASEPGAGQPPAPDSSPGAAPEEAPGPAPSPTPNPAPAPTSQPSTGAEPEAPPTGTGGPAPRNSGAGVDGSEPVTQPVGVVEISPPRNGKNLKEQRARAVELIRSSGMPARAADALINCQALPALAKKLVDWDNKGLPVRDMLAALQPGLLMSPETEKPAAWASVVLGSRAARHRRDQAAAAEGSGQDSDREPTPADGAASTKAQPRPTEAPAVDIQVDAVEATDAARLVDAAELPTEPVTDAVEVAGTQVLLESLDPTSPLDRIALESGTGSAGQEELAEQMLREGSSASGQTDVGGQGGDERGGNDHRTGEPAVGPPPAVETARPLDEERAGAAVPASTGNEGTLEEPTAENLTEEQQAARAAVEQARVIFESPAAPPVQSVDGGQAATSVPSPSQRPSPRRRPSPHSRSAPGPSR